MTLIDDNRLFRIAFERISARNQKARRHVLKANISPRQLPEMHPSELHVLGFSAGETEQIKKQYLDIAGEEFKRAQQAGVQIIFREDADYPPLLAEIYQPPDFIYALGDVSLLRAPCKLAVVGSRRGGQYGRACLNRIIPDLCLSGVLIVSGMAYGIDSWAHEAALKENGKTIGVNAGGLLHLYPAGNKGLIDHIVREGCIISEFSLDTEPRPFYFPIRNRIIAGISRGVLVVEAAMKSGSLVTARLALDQNREVMAIPGNIDSPISQGTNYLLQQGARVITQAADVLQLFNIAPPPAKKQSSEFSAKEQIILDLMPGNEVKSIDYFVERLDFSVSETISVMMGLILKNAVREESGGYKRIV